MSHPFRHSSASAAHELHSAELPLCSDPADDGAVKLRLNKASQQSHLPLCASSDKVRRCPSKLLSSTNSVPDPPPTDCR